MKVCVTCIVFKIDIGERERGGGRERERRKVSEKETWNGSERSKNNELKQIKIFVYTKIQKVTKCPENNHLFLE